MKDRCAMEKLLIIDGSNLLFQMFYGMPRKIYNANGETIHATIGFVGALFKIIRWLEPDYITVIFDSDSKLKRKKLDKDYKANRDIDWSALPDDEVPFFEIKKIQKVLDKANIFNMEAKDMEADDLISSITYQFQDDYKVIISSFDSDFFQLINKNVEILRYRGKNSKIIDEDSFMDKYDFPPNKYVNYKSLVGDSADNIKGLERIGHKRASNLVKRFDNYNEVLRNVDTVLPKSIRKSLIEQEDRYRLNIDLISLNNNKSSKFNVDDLKYNREYLQGSSNDLLKEVGIFD